ncbi:nondiscriminating glutamyl-tRNA synthetase [uncultured bacterium]|nr:nondiscriminating glutamyl-tRNA synthetase [uncultured bacterium]
MPNVRTRFAPSPTGRLHIGNVRTALFNWLFAKERGGSFVLRIEDTDTARSRFEYELSIIEDLKWLGLEWDEGPDKGGEFGPYRQSERRSLHKAAAVRLVTEGKAYKCYCTKEQLEDLKSAQMAAGLPPRYDGRCRELAPEAMQPGAPFTVRFRVPEKDVRVDDGVHGLLAFDSRNIGDFVIVGSDGVAAYNFAAVVDDALMNVTHVIRGDDHLSNTPRQLLLFEALELKAPEFTHIPLVLGPDKTPLSKRHGSFSIEEIRAGGFLPEAVVNAVARLGWNPGESLVELAELAPLFSIDKLSASPSEFNVERLKFYNKAAIQKSKAERLIELSSLSTAGGPEETERVVEAVKGNASDLKELKELSLPFLTEPQPGEEEEKELSEPHARAVVKAFRQELEKIEAIDQGSYKELVEAVKAATGEKGKRLLMPLRLALTGTHSGIELAGVLTLLGKERAVQRLRKYE